MLTPLLCNVLFTMLLAVSYCLIRYCACIAAACRAHNPKLPAVICPYSTSKHAHGRRRKRQCSRVACQAVLRSRTPPAAVVGLRSVAHRPRREILRCRVNRCNPTSAPTQESSRKQWDAVKHNHVARRYIVSTFRGVVQGGPTFASKSGAQHMHGESCNSPQPCGKRLRHDIPRRLSQSVSRRGHTCQADARPTSPMDVPRANRPAPMVGWYGCGEGGSTSVPLAASQEWAAVRSIIDAMSARA